MRESGCASRFATPVTFSSQPEGPSRNGLRSGADQAQILLVVLQCRLDRLAQHCEVALVPARDIWWERACRILQRKSATRINSNVLCSSLTRGRTSSSENSWLSGAAPLVAAQSC